MSMDTGGGGGRKWGNGKEEDRRLQTRKKPRLLVGLWSRGKGTGRGGCVRKGPWVPVQVGAREKGCGELVKQQGSWHRTKPLPADTPPSSKLLVAVPGVGWGLGKRAQEELWARQDPPGSGSRAQKGEGARVWPRSVLRTL